MVGSPSVNPSATMSWLLVAITIYCSKSFLNQFAPQSSLLGQKVLQPLNGISVIWFISFVFNIEMVLKLTLSSFSIFGGPFCLWIWILLYFYHKKILRKSAGKNWKMKKLGNLLEIVSRVRSYMLWNTNTYYSLQSSSFYLTRFIFVYLKPR